MRFSLRFLSVLCVSAVAFCADNPRITYTKAFPKSVPEFVSITVNRDGTAEYRETPDEEPLKFRLNDHEAGAIFSLAEKLDNFSRPLESGLKVAFSGKKTFKYENGSVNHEVTFNYSTDPAARDLWDWFERISESERHRIALEHAARFDRLGVNQALLELEASRDRARLVAVEQYLPILDRIVKNQSLMHMARERAAKLAEGFRGTTGATEQ